MAYIENEKRYEINGWLVIGDAKGNNIHRIPVQKNWNIDPLWVNEHAFVFNIIDSGNLPSVLLIDTFTGDQKNFVQSSQIFFHMQDLLVIPFTLSIAVLSMTPTCDLLFILGPIPMEKDRWFYGIR